MKGAFIAGLLFSSAAFAWLPPSHYVFRTLGKRHAPAETITCKHKITFLKKSGEPDRTAIELLVISGGNATVSILDESGALLAKHSRKLAGDFPFSYDVFFIKDSVAMIDRMKARGLPVKTEKELYGEKPEAKAPEEPPPQAVTEDGEVHVEALPKPYIPEPAIALMRFENRPLVVIGAGKGDGPQLWLDKESLVPMRAIFDRAEVRSSGWQMFKNFLYPRSIQLFREGRAFARLETLDVRTGSADESSIKGKGEASGDLSDYLETHFAVFR